MTLDKPQVHCIYSSSLKYAPSDVKWLPCSAKLACIGQQSRGQGVLQVLQLSNSKLEVISEHEYPTALKCCTMNASPLHQRNLATGDYEGNMKVYNLEQLSKPVYSVKAHDSIINCIDGCSGSNLNTGPPEIVTGSRDGTVKVWDTRQKETPVATILPAKGESHRDVWAVAFGNSFNDHERVVASGYENGDVKLFDLKTMSLLNETNLKNGVCGLEFDRRDIKMNKLVATTLESTVCVFDLRTQHPQTGFAMTTHKAPENTTIWTVKHLPQNRDVFMASSGNGGINSNYPSNRSTMDSKKEHMEGVSGTLQILNDAIVAEQPISSFDWSPDKLGLFACTSFDQQLRVGVVTKLNAI